MDLAPGMYLVIVKFIYNHVTDSTKLVFRSLRVNSVSGELVKTSSFMNGSLLLRYWTISSVRA